MYDLGPQNEETLGGAPFWGFHISKRPRRSRFQDIHEREAESREEMTLLWLLERLKIRGNRIQNR